MMKTVEHDFSETVKTNSEEGIQKIGEIDGIGLYYDKYGKRNQFLIGYKERTIKFIVGKSKDIEKFRKAFETYKNNKY